MQLDSLISETEGDRGISLDPKNLRIHLPDRLALLCPSFGAYAKAASTTDVNLFASAITGSSYCVNRLVRPQNDSASLITKKLYTLPRSGNLIVKVGSRARIVHSPYQAVYTETVSQQIFQLPPRCPAFDRSVSLAYELLHVCFQCRHKTLKPLHLCSKNSSGLHIYFALRDLTVQALRPERPAY